MRKTPLHPAATDPPVPLELIERRIYVNRGQKVMLDADLAELYQVPTRALNQVVSRNPDRFPNDFIFQLTAEEADSLRSQIVISNQGRGGRRYLPYAFTEHGVAMLSSVLHSQRAVHSLARSAQKNLRSSKVPAGRSRASASTFPMKRSAPCKFASCP